MEEKKSAKVILRELQDKIAQDVWGAKNRGEKIGWCASNFPQEITTAMGIQVTYPENMGAAVGASTRRAWAIRTTCAPTRASTSPTRT